MTRKTLWCVASGPDASHLVDVSWFSRLKDAKEYSLNLPLTPLGKARPHLIEKHVFGDWA